MNNDSVPGTENPTERCSQEWHFECLRSRKRRRHPTCNFPEFPCRGGDSLTSGGRQLEHTPSHVPRGGICVDSSEAAPVTSRRRSGRIFVRALICVFPAVLGLAFLPGCDDTYDKTTLYPPRAD